MDEVLIKNYQLFDEVYELLKQVRATKKGTIWRGTTITPIEADAIKIKHGNLELQHRKIGLLTVSLLTRFHSIEL